MCEFTSQCGMGLIYSEGQSIRFATGETLITNCTCKSHQPASCNVCCQPSTDLERHIVAALVSQDIVERLVSVHIHLQYPLLTHLTHLIPSIDHTAAVITAFIVRCVGGSKAPPVLHSSYRTVFERDCAV